MKRDHVAHGLFQALARITIIVKSFSREDCPRELVGRSGRMIDQLVHDIAMKAKTQIHAQLLQQHLDLSLRHHSPFFSASARSAASLASTRPRPLARAWMAPRMVATSCSVKAARPSMTRRFWLIERFFSGG